MNRDDEPTELKPTWVDHSAALARGAANLVPFVGPFFAEIFGTIIPNQRMDRIAKFVAEIDRRLERTENKISDTLLRDEAFTDLLEEGFRQAAHSLSDERRGYIASVILSGLDSAEIEYAESRHLLRILDEINDVEAIWLWSYARRIRSGDETFREIHKQVLTRVVAYLGSSEEIRYKQALQDSYREHLAQLGLLERRFRTDMETRTPQFDSFTGAMKVSGYELTSLGRLLLREIGLETDK